MNGVNIKELEDGIKVSDESRILRTGSEASTTAESCDYNDRDRF